MCRGTGRIGPVELKGLLEQYLGPDCLTADDFLRVMLLLDRNRDGWVDYDEFQGFMEQGASGFEVSTSHPLPIPRPLPPSAHLSASTPPPACS